MKLDYILANREYVKNYVISAIKQDAQSYGIEVKAVEIESIQLGNRLELDIARVALGKIEAQANLIIARGELEAAKMVAKTAALNDGNPIGLQLQYLETLKLFAEKNQTTLVLPDSILGKGHGFHVPKKIVEMCKKNRLKNEAAQ